jgi:topoisomerase IA-like protein
MKEQYIDERFGIYFEFGEHGDGRVDIASSQNDTVATVTREHAKNLIEDRNSLRHMLVRLALKLDEIDHKEFSKIWYDSSESATTISKESTPKQAEAVSTNFMCTDCPYKYQLGYCKDCTYYR